MPSKWQRRYASNKRAHALLRERWPGLFTWARPLAIGIDQQISDAFGDQLDHDDLRGFLRWWTKRPAYVAALGHGDRRANLNGSDAGPAFCEGFAARQADAA